MNFQERKARLNELTDKYPEFKRAIKMGICVKAYNLLSKNDKIMKQMLSSRLDDLVDGLEKELKDMKKLRNSKI